MCMNKALIVILSIPCACLIAGIYGILHNQISYTVSSEYFTHFKFQQFGLIHFYDRLGAALVGWAASWWMGGVTAILFIPLTLGISEPRQTMNALIRGIGIVLACALSMGLIALLWALTAIDDQFAPHYQVPEGVSNRAAFLQAGTMHNYSYLGAFIGIGIGMWYIRNFRKARKSLK